MEFSDPTILKKCSKKPQNGKEELRLNNVTIMMSIIKTLLSLEWISSWLIWKIHCQLLTSN